MNFAPPLSGLRPGLVPLAVVVMVLLSLGFSVACRKAEAPAAAGAATAAPSTAPASSANATAATPAAAAAPAISWEDDLAAWKQWRRERLERPTGWLTLVGFFWLEPGDNVVGSAAASGVRLPAGKGPDRLGVLRLADGVVTFEAAPGANVMSEGQPVTKLTLASDRDGQATTIESGTITFYVIERSGRLAVRMRDSEAETLKRFAGLDYYPVDRAWRLEARFEPAKEPTTLPIPNILGFDEAIASPGWVVFEAGGRENRILALDDTGDGRLFLVFGDTTNGKETYGGGRFLYTDPPADGKVVVDFNRAYNPPCVFTPYATCPLPPKGNRLPFAVPAGEKKYEHEAAHSETAEKALARNVAG